VANYYFLGTRLPALQIGEVPEITFQELATLLGDNLTNKDYSKVVVLRRFLDIQNIRNLWTGRPFDRHGNYDEKELEEALLNREGLPGYVFSFIDKYENIDLQLKHFSELVSTYFVEEGRKATGFLKEYLKFEREMRLVLLGYRAKQLGRNPAVELQYENPEDPIVLQILGQQEAKQYEPPEGFEDLKTLFEGYKDKPLVMYQKLVENRFSKIDRMVGMDPFTTERILGYLIRFILVERWLELDQEQGIKIVDTIIKEAS
jgi:hypothetical protein